MVYPLRLNCGQWLFLSFYLLQSLYWIFYIIFFFFFLMFWVLWPGGMWDLNFPTRIEPESPALEGQVLNMGLPGKSLPVILDWYNNGSEKKTGKLDNNALVSSPYSVLKKFLYLSGCICPFTLNTGSMLCSVGRNQSRAQLIFMLWRHS